MNYFLLILSWILYYAIHSILASSSVKAFFQKRFKKSFRYYRLGYSVFATITLILLLYFQYSFESPVLLDSVWIKYFAILFLIFPGLTIMFISIKKYFMLLSGVRSIFTPVPASELKVNGIHRFVRHPLYSGTILFVWGLFFVFPFVNNLIAVVLLTLYVLIGISFEEKKLVQEFGRKYEGYMRGVPMLIPRFRNLKNWFSILPFLPWLFWQYNWAILAGTSFKHFKSNAMFFTGISIAFVVMVIVVIFIYRHFYLKKKARNKQDEDNQIKHD